jgi:hypothetical protein
MANMSGGVIYSYVFAENFSRRKMEDFVTTEGVDRREID